MVRRTLAKTNKAMNMDSNSVGRKPKMAATRLTIPLNIGQAMFDIDSVVMVETFCIELRQDKFSGPH